MKKKIIICLAAFTLLLPAIALIFILNKPQETPPIIPTAPAASTISASDLTTPYRIPKEEYEVYTDTDYLYNPVTKEKENNRKISDYKSGFKSGEGPFFQKDGHIRTNITNATIDDEIVKIVPRNAFIHRGKHLIIGKEYGMFIETIENTEYSNSSTVLVFDITTYTDYMNSKTPDQIGSSVKVLFQYEYAFMLPNSNGEYSIKLYGDGNYKYNFNFNFPDGIIVRMPYYSILGSNFEVVYPNAEKFSLKDISFRADLLNEQYLNPGDLNYTPEDDNGNFITRTDYDFNGVTVYNKKYNANDIVSDSAVLGMGILSTAAGTACPAVGALVLGISVFDFILGFTESPFYDKYVAHDSRWCAKLNFNSRENQIDRYGYLMKTANAALLTGNTRYENPLLFKKGHSATAWYTLNRTTHTFTRFQSTVFVNIVKEIGNGAVEIVYGGYNSYNHEVGVKQYKDLNLNTITDGYALPNGTDYFKFTPQYSGRYIISSESNIIFSDTNNNTKTVYLTGRAEYKFSAQFSDNSSGLFNVMMKVAAQTDDINIRAKDTYITAFYSKTDELYKFTANGSVKIAILNSDFLCVKDSASNNVYQKASGGETLYVLLTNTANSALTTNLIISFPEVLEEDTEYTKSIGKEFTYYKFVASKSSYYAVVSNYKSGVFYTDFPESTNSNIGTPFDSTTYGCTVTNIYLKAGQAFHLGFKIDSTKEENVIIKFAKAEKTYQWVTGSGNKEKGIPDNTLIIPRGSSQIVRLKVNEYYFEGFIYNLTSSTGNYSYSNYTLSISANRQLFNNDEDNYIILVAADSKLEIMPLFVKVAYDVQPVFETYKTSSSDYGIKWKNSLSNVSTDNFKISLMFIYANGSTQTKNDLSISKPAANGSINLKDYADKSNIYEFTVEITKLVLSNLNKTSVDIYVNKPEMTHNIDISNELKINPYFSGGDGTASNPFQIKTADDLKNTGVSSNVDLNYKLVSNISLTDYWSAIKNFYGTLDGNGYSVKNLKISASAEGNYGLFAINRGTIENLTLEYVTIDIGTSWNTSDAVINAGAFAGMNTGAITNCVITAGLPYDTTYHMYFYNYNINSYMGGIAGYNSSRISNCINNLILSGNGNIGGIAGYNRKMISNCKNTGYISYSSYAVYNLTDNKSIGGIVAVQEEDSGIYTCHSAGGIIYANTDTTGNKYLKPRIGQIVGWRKLGITNSNTAATYIVDISRLTVSQAEYAGNRQIGRMGT